MMDWIWFLLGFTEPAVMAAVVSSGFAVLFNVPVKTLPMIAILGALGVTVKFSLMTLEWSSIESTFVAACGVGLCSMWLAWRYHCPAVVFSLPAVIPMVPGVFAYRTMMGMLEFTRLGGLDQQLLIEIASNGMTTAFLFLCLAIGVSLPNFLLRGRSIRNVFGACPGKRKKLQYDKQTPPRVR